MQAKLKSVPITAVLLMASIVPGFCDTTKVNIDQVHQQFAQKDATIKTLTDQLDAANATIAEQEAQIGEIQRQLDGATNPSLVNTNFAPPDEAAQIQTLTATITKQQDEIALLKCEIRYGSELCAMRLRGTGGDNGGTSETDIAPAVQMPASSPTSSSWTPSLVSQYQEAYADVAATWSNLTASTSIPRSEITTDCTKIAADTQAMHTDLSRLDQQSDYPGKYVANGNAIDEGTINYCRKYATFPAGADMFPMISLPGPGLRSEHSISAADMQPARQPYISPAWSGTTYTPPPPVTPMPGTPGGGMSNSGGVGGGFH